MADNLNITESEAMVSDRRQLEYNASDADLIQAIDKAISESSELKSQMDEQGKRNKLYWKRGTAIPDELHPNKSKALVNRIFTDAETLIPIITSETPEGVVLGSDDPNVKNALQKGLAIAYESKYRMKQKLQKMCRHWMISKVGVIKYRWDKSKSAIVFENVLPKKIGFDKRATDKNNCEYMFEEMEDKIEDLITKFPKAKTQIEQKFGKDKPKSKVKYKEFWGGNSQWVTWKLQDIILDKLKNPNFDYDNPENNIFDIPQFPYLILNVFNLGDETSLYDDASLIEVCIPTQDAIKDLERMAIDLNKGRKRVWALDSSVISEKVRQQLIDETGDLAIVYNGKLSPHAVQQAQAGIFDASMQDNLLHLLAEIDNQMGVHPSTKGQQGANETAKGHQMLIQADYGRVDPIVTAVEDVTEEWYNAYLQMLKVYATNGEKLSNGKDTILIDPMQIPAGISVMVQKGTTLPTDEHTKHDQAMGLAKEGMMSPKTLYEEIDYPNPDQYFQELVQWLQLTGKIAPQQPPMAQGGAGQPQGGQQPTAMPQNASQANPVAEQAAARIEQQLKSPQFQSLPSEQQAAFIQKAKAVMAQITGQQAQGQPAQAAPQ